MPALNLEASRADTVTTLPLGMHPSAHAVTYYTVSDNRFFLGTVALLNSLRLTGTPESSWFSIPA